MVFLRSTTLAVTKRLRSTAMVNSNTNPARAGTVVSLFGTGGGPTIKPLPDGAVATEAIWLAGDVRVFVGGVEAMCDIPGPRPAWWLRPYSSTFR
jgi:uncharacterized protein (TIGR03437 family)